MSFLTEEVYNYPEFCNSNPMAVLSGRDCFDEPISNVPLNDMHLMVVGASGMGKSVQIRKILKQTSQNSNSIHIIFDPKGEFYREFYREGIDYVISLFDLPNGKKAERWNLMQDVIADNYPETAIDEIAKAICKEAIDGSTNKFFPKSAELLIAAIWKMAYRLYKDNLPTNKTLINFTRNVTYKQLLNEAQRKDLNGHMINEDILPVIKNLFNPNGGVTTANIRQEMEQILTTAFNPQGNFCSEGTFSVRNFIRQGKGKRLFLVYDFATAENSKQIFSILLNLMMKDCISIKRQETNDNSRIYYYLDELPVLPGNITNFAPICNFGRSAGNRVIIGIQSLSQLYDIYGENAGNSIISAFTDNIIMKTNDPITVEKLAKRSGRIEKIRTSMGATRDSIQTKTEQTYTIPEKVIANLSVGQAVVSLQGTKPFYIYFDL